jgi:hypothetical protein
MSLLTSYFKIETKNEKLNAITWHTKQGIIKKSLISHLI